MNKIYTHHIDEGHGGSDCGAVGFKSHEADINLAIGKRVDRILIAHGQKVSHTRTTDRYLTLAARADIANRAGCATFTSIHCNSASNKTAHGVETFSYPNSATGAKLSRLVQTNLVNATGLTDRGCKTANFGVLRMSKMPAILVESAFISHVLEENLLLSVEYQEKIATSIVKGIFSYLGLSFNGAITPANNVILTAKPSTVAHIYRIRLSWDAVKTQKGAFSDLANALAFVKTLPGYKVFDESGNVVGSNVVQATASVSNVDPNVKALQQLCNTLGIKDMNGNALIVDGLDGTKTRYAVARLPLCGIKYTQKAATKYIQGRLNALGYRDNNGKVLSVDGVYFTASAQAVAKYQRAKGLGSDQIVGGNTWVSFLK